MTERIHQPGDRVEWDIGKSVRRGVVESVGAGKNAGLAMVREAGHAKSRLITVARLRDAKTHTASVPTGGEVA